MANRKNTFLLKRSNIAGKVPAAGSLLLGELGLNIAGIETARQFSWERTAREILNGI